MIPPLTSSQRAAPWVLLAVTFLPLQSFGQTESSRSPSKPPNPSAQSTTPDAVQAEKHGNDNRERWKNLSPEKQKEIQKLFERLRELPPAERKKLLERLRLMSSVERREALERARGSLDPLEGDSRNLRRDLIRGQLETLPPEEKARLRQLSPEERRKFVEEKLSERRKRILSSLPEGLREEAKKMPPQEQAEFLRRLRGEEIFSATFRDPGEAQKVRSLPPRRLRESLRVPPEGNPPPKPGFLSEETWRRWLELKPFERVRVLRQLIDSEVTRPQTGASSRRAPSALGGQKKSTAPAGPGASESSKAL